MSFEISSLIRKKIATFLAQQKKSNITEDNIRFDQNSNLFGSPLAGDYHRHDDGLLQKALTVISDIKRIPMPNILLHHSNYASMELLLQTFCEPKVDNILICPPTMSIFEQAAVLHDVAIKRVLLNDDYQLDLDGIAEAIDENTKIIFLASPNDPTANSLHREDIEVLLHNFEGVVVIDETYINYARSRSFWYEIKEFPNLVVLQNFDQAWGLAALNLATVFADSRLIDTLKSLMATRTVSDASMEKFIVASQQIDQINQWTRETVMLRDFLARELQQLSVVKKVYPSDSNFLLVAFRGDIQPIEAYLLAHKIAVKNMHQTILCENCLRISVKNLQDNELLINVLRQINNKEQSI
jgi:histidinol-phosphate aminotransferase